MADSAPAAGDSIALALAPAWVKQSSWLARWYRLPATRRGILVTIAFSALVFLPWLGAVGFWDCWEPHYAEAARNMLVRDDYLYPWWSLGYFFSKPAFLLWMDALAMNIVGIHTHFLPAGAQPFGTPTPSGISIYTEWAVRTPVALLAVLGCVFAYVACERLISRRVGLIAAAAMATMPFYELLARHAITDMPETSLMTCGTACFAIALWDEDCWRTAWAYAGYAFLGFATLAKGLLGFCIPGAAFLAWFVVTGDWAKIARLKLVEKVRGLWLPVGPLIFLAICAPWYTILSLFDGRDDEGKTFNAEFWIHDHFDRLLKGVHTTTPGGTFDYFLEQLGYGLFPWVAAVPGAISELGRVKVKEKTPKDSFVILCGLWAGVIYVLMSLSATKFHHYIFPAIPPIAVLCAVWLERLWTEGLEDNAVAALVGFGLAAVIAQNLWMEPKHFTDLFVYNYDRPYPDKELAELHPGRQLGPFYFSMAPRAVMAALFGLGGAGVIVAWLWRSKKWVVSGFMIFAAVFAIWLSWFHWRELSPHWSQRDIFWTYLEQRGSPDEPIAAYFMNWRGETFYSRNLVRQIQDNQRINDFVAPPGREWVIVEQARLQALRSALGNRYKLRIADRSCNKFFLVAVEDAAAPPSGI